jgi:hypothetical protein
VGQGTVLNGCGDGRGQLWIREIVEPRNGLDETASKDPDILHFIGASNERIL